MTRLDLTALAVNGIIGAGIFGLPSSVSRLLGVSSPVAFVVCAVLVYVFVLCFAEVASHFSDTGGPYLYSRTIFGPFVGFEVGWSVWLARVSAFAANSNVLILYLGYFLPQATSGVGRAVIIALIPTVLAAINVRGVKGGAHVGDVFAGTKIGVLALFGIIGLFFVDWTRFSGMGVPQAENFGPAILLLIYAFTGFEYAVIPAAEAKDPRRDLAWALIIALGICTIIYIAVQVVAQGTVADLTISERPLADSAQTFLGPLAGGVIAMLVIVSVIGNLSALMLVSPRLTYAFAEKRDFPAIFARLHPVYQTPAVSIVFFAAASGLLAIYGRFEWLVAVSVVSRLGYYMVTCLAVPILRRRSDSEVRFRLPLGATLPVLGLAIGIWLLLQASRLNILAFAGACVAGAILFLFRPRRSSKTG
jgi:amino acid transporter